MQHGEGLLIRTSGILMHLTSLPSPYGIGTMGKAAYDFVDFLYASGQGLWQILPMNPVGYGDSPYQSFSSFAGNPYLIDLDMLKEDGLLADKDLHGIDWGRNPNSVDFGKIHENRFKILKIAFTRYKERNTHANSLNAFKKENAFWIKDFSLFMALKSHYQDCAWYSWPEDAKTHNPSEMEEYEVALKDDIEFWVFTQYVFFAQWYQLKKYANDKGIRIIGDIPFYIAHDSSDVWANPQLFQLDDNFLPVRVAGCPPDAFSNDGQLWGNPIYRWDRMKSDQYEWWVERIKAATIICDVIRIDHFRGFDSYYAIPYGERTSRNGVWCNGPGYDFFQVLKDRLNDPKIIAEDLGYLTDSVRSLLRKTGYPGMKVLQFAFDSREESDYLPHNYDKHCVVYTGTHDNDTIRGWFESAPEKDVLFCKEYLGLQEKREYVWGMIRAAWSSVGNIAIVPMQDFLELDSESRMNTPSTIGGNWNWRASKKDFTQKLSDRILEMTRLYGRYNYYESK